ncbi:hypothetical protein LLB_1379 [Legionella longbeachae D-4968]|nr:hypothetical protein LLB_1379 [Legionella longbeachae D-4968]
MHISAIFLYITESLFTFFEQFRLFLSKIQADLFNFHHSMI